MMGKNGTEEGKELQDRILNLTSRLEGELVLLKNKHTSELEAITKKCRDGIHSLDLNFTRELDVIQLAHHQKMLTLEHNIQYLKEMTQSQRLMMETNLNYIKELEGRIIS